MRSLQKRPVLIYDAECGFCRRSVVRIRARTGHRVRFVPLQAFAVPLRFGVARADARRAVQLIEPSGERFEEADAIFRTLARAHRKGWRAVAWLGGRPGLRNVSSWAYRLIARHRTFVSSLGHLLPHAGSQRPQYRVVRWVYLRSLGIVYLAAFASLHAQVLGLYGKRGILPVREWLAWLEDRVGARDRYWQVPALLWLDPSDAGLVNLCRVGEAASVGLIFNVAPRALSLLAWAVYLSFVSAGEVFMSFQWDALLLESGLHAVIAAPGGLRPRLGYGDVPRSVVLLMRWLVFRLHFGSGIAKLRTGDPTWRRGTALSYHHETQPLPTPLGWHLHHLPKRAHRVATGLVLLAECVAPFLAFGPRRFREAGFATMLALQVGIAASGNYGFFNWLSVADLLWLLDDRAFGRLLPQRAGAASPPASFGYRLAAAVLAVPILAVSLLKLIGGTSLSARLLRKPSLLRILRKIEPLRSTNSYALFSVMTRHRPEIAIECSDDGRTWYEYEFRYKPGDLHSRPPWVAPHQPRLDWQMWFAALGPPPEWFANLIRHLLLGTRQVQTLFRTIPIERPRFVRALLYDYRMTDRETRRRTGEWWQRKLIGVYFPEMALAAPSDGPPPDGGPRSSQNSTHPASISR